MHITHWPFHFKDCSDVIIEKINCLLLKYERDGGNINKTYYAKYIKYKSKYLKSNLFYI